MTGITREEIEKWRGVQAEALMSGHPPDNASASFSAVLDAAERSLTEQSHIDAAARKRVAELLAENARLREGLDFYAKIEHYLDFDNGWPGCAIYEDRGRLARALLAGSPTP